MPDDATESKTKQSPDDLVRHLNEQLGFLRSSGEQFDRGIQAEAKRCATAIRILVWDKGRNQSVLSQLGVKNGLRFMDTSLPPEPSQPIPLGGGRFKMSRRKDAGLAAIQLGDGPRYVATHDNRPRRPSLPFKPWWRMRVLTDNKGKGFSREELVLGVAHKDGGAHVDPVLEKAYAELARSNSIGWTVEDEAGNILLSEGPVLANVRQVAWELQRTIEQQLAQLTAVS